MAHKLLPEVIESEPKSVKTYKLPNFNGKFGVAFMVGTKEIFIGVSVGEVEIEQIVRRRITKTPRTGVKVFRFDPNS